MTPTIHQLLRDLEHQLAIVDEPGFTEILREALAGTDLDVEAFLKSNELWGGSGSIADQAGVAQGQDAARRIQVALIALGNEQIRLHVVNPRTKSWVHAFSEWQRKGL